MVNLRELAESDLAVTLEDEVSGFGLPIELISPDGEVDVVSGQILYDTMRMDEATGVPIVVHKPVATVRVRSLARVPVNGEVWAVRIPIEPSRTAAKVTFLIEDVSQDGRSLGFVRLYLVRTKQS